MVSIRDTRVEFIHYVFPRHANVQGTLYGGHMMNWIVSAGTMAASRTAKSEMVLASMDDLYFVNPVRVGDIVAIVSQVDYIGRTSMEVSAWVFAEKSTGGDRRPATVAHMTFVAIDENCKPKPIERKIEPVNEDERRSYESALRSREERLKGIGDRHQKVFDIGMDVEGEWTLRMSRIVFPEDAVIGRLMFAGRLLMMADELASILALRYARSNTVTAAVDSMNFYSPIKVGDIVSLGAALNYVGRSSMEIGVKVVAEDPLKAEQRHTCTLYLTFVGVGPDGMPKPLPPWEPRTETERQRWSDAQQRKERRMIRLKDVENVLRSHQIPSSREA